MATVSWKAGAGNGVWTTAANWSSGAVPGAGDTVSLASTTINTITFPSGLVTTIAALTSASGGINDILSMSSGTLTVPGFADFATGLVTGSSTTLNLGAASTIGTGYKIGGSTIVFGSATASLTVSGAGTFSATLTGPGTLTSTGTMASQGVTLGNGATWSVSGTVNLTGNLNLDSYVAAVSKYVAGSLSIAAGGTFNIGNANLYHSNAASTITNAGTLAKTGGTGTTTIDNLLVNSGTLKIASGAINLTGGFTNTGTISSVAGTTLELSHDGDIAGTLALDSGSTLYLNYNTFTLGGGTGNVTWNQILVLKGTISLGSGQVLTLANNADILTGTYLGAGKLVTTGTMTAQGITFGNGATWSVAGTVNLTSNLNLDSYVAAVSKYVAGSLSIAAGGTFNIGNANLYHSNAASTITNAGTLAKTGGTGTTTIDNLLVNSGTLKIASGAINLTGGFTNTGTISSVAGTTLELSHDGDIAGTLALDSGSTLYLNYNTFTLGGGTGNVTWNQILVLKGTISLGSGQVLTLANNADILTGTYLGAGKLVTTGTMIAQGITFGNGATWSVAGTVNLTSNLWLDSYVSAVSKYVAGALSIAAGGTFNIAADANLYHSNAASTITNAGTLAKTGGTGTTTIDNAIANTGTLAATSGTLSLTGAVTSSGTITAGTGFAVQMTGGGNLGGTIGAATATGTITAKAGAFTTSASLSLADEASATTLHLATGWTVSGTVTDYGAVSLDTSSAVLTIASGGTWVLSGSDARFIVTAGKIANAGTLAKAGAGSVTITAAIANTGLVDVQSGTLAFGATALPTGTGTLRIEAGATLELGAAPASTQTIAFNGIGATLRLDTPFSTNLTGFGAGNSLDFVGKAVSAVSIAGNVLTVTIGGTAYTYSSSLSLASLHAGILSDGNGGSLVVVDGLATAGSATPSSVAFGTVHVGAKPTQAIALGNTAAPGASEALDASVATASSQFVATGSFTGLAAGSTSTTALSVGFAPTAAGAFSGSATVTLKSDGAGIDGWGQTALASQTIALSGTAWAYATAKLTSTTISLGAAHLGAVAKTTLALTDSATTAAYTEALDATISGTTGAVTGSGSVSLLGAGQTNSTSLALTLATTTAGAVSGTATLALTSDGQGTSGLGKTALGSQTVTVSGTVYALATPTLATTSLALGVVHVGDTVTRALSLTDIATNTAYTEALDANFAVTTGAVTGTGSVSLLGAGQTNSSGLVLALNTTASGSVSGTATLALTSDGQGTSGLGKTALTGKTVSVTATVDAYAVAGFAVQSGYTLGGSASAGYTLNLGTVLQGSAPVTVSLGALNAATGLADLLGGTISVVGGTDFANTGFGSFSGLGAGQKETLQSVTLSTTSSGTFSETITLSANGSNSSGYLGATQTVTLTVTGTVASSGNYTLVQGPNVLTGANGVNDIFYASAGSLNSRDQLTGGNGQNTLVLQGAGLFDINAPKVLAAIPTIQANEGQDASGALAATSQVVLMRDNASETLNVAAATTAAGNANPVGITIYGGNGTDTINLATGADIVWLDVGTTTITLGGSANQVHGGGGTATINASIANAGALIQGAATGSTTLHLTNAGSATLNAADTNLTVVAQAGSAITLSKQAGVTADGSAGAITLTALATGQTLIGGKGDTLVGGAGGDSFVFHPGFGAETVSGFVATGTTHDTLAIDHTLFADWAHLAAATTQHGADLWITYDAADVIVLKNVAMAAFTANDALFV